MGLAKSHQARLWVDFHLPLQCGPPVPEPQPLCEGSSGGVAATPSRDLALLCLLGLLLPGGRRGGKSLLDDESPLWLHQSISLSHSLMLLSLSGFSSSSAAWLSKSVPCSHHTQASSLCCPLLPVPGSGWLHVCVGPLGPMFLLTMSFTWPPCWVSWEGTCYSQWSSPLCWVGSVRLLPSLRCGGFSCAARSAGCAHAT